MSMSLLLLLASFQPATLPLEASAPLRVVAEDPVPDKRPEVEKALEKFKEHTEKKGSEDRDAVTLIDTTLLPEFKKSGPKDKAAIVAALVKVYDLRRPEEKEGVPNIALFIAAGAALGEMGPESTKPLVGAIDNKNIKKQMAVRSRLILSLGKTRDVKDAVDPLINLLQDKDAPIVSAAGEALGEFGGADLATRKKAFEALLKIVTAAKDNMDSNPQDTIARDRYDAIASAIVTALGKLSKHDERAPDKWRDWWNKNKTKNWDDTK